MLAALVMFAAIQTGVPPADVQVCMQAAAAATHSTVKDSDHDGCVCTVEQLRKMLVPNDYDLHEKMEAIIASGADEKSFNAQVSDIMKRRGMNQLDADAFLSRSHAAEVKASETCNSDPLFMH